ncbi:hypothetical protein IKF86_00410 [Candidatus Saccharibacteria bacterium]|nr:hypothetical protein [Candidatus Saccharibacteria bacterium]
MEGDHYRHSVRAATLNNDIDRRFGWAHSSAASSACAGVQLWVPAYGWSTLGDALYTFAAYYFVRSGNVNGSTLYNFTGNANYWSSTAVSASQAYNLNFNSGGVWPANRNNRNNGRSLRCVAR